MAKEQKEQKDELSYNELKNVAAQLQQQLAERDAALRNVNEIREMAYICLQLLDHKDVLPEEMLTKVLDFLDKLIPVPKEQQE
jgi:hypothetical protein